MKSGFSSWTYLFFVNQIKHNRTIPRTARKINRKKLFFGVFSAKNARMPENTFNRPRRRGAPCFPVCSSGSCFSYRSSGIPEKTLSFGVLPAHCFPAGKRNVRSDLARIVSPMVAKCPPLSRLFPGPPCGKSDADPAGDRGPVFRAARKETHSLPDALDIQKKDDIVSVRMR